MDIQSSDVITAPNAISVFRTILAWVAIAALWQCIVTGARASAPFWLGLFVLAVALDALDGWLARRYDTASSIGSFVDILADRLTEYPGWILLGYAVPSLLLLVLVIVARNVLVDGVKLEAARKGITMKSGVPKMSAAGELIVNHPVCKTLHNVLKLTAIILGLAGVLFLPQLQIAAFIVLAIHTVFCILRGLGSVLELRSI
jgi:phosphatidylglycerophosphate synthase